MRMKCLFSADISSYCHFLACGKKMYDKQSVTTDYYFIVERGIYIYYFKQLANRVVDSGGSERCLIFTQSVVSKVVTLPYFGITTIKTTFAENTIVTNLVSLGRFCTIKTGENRSKFSGPYIALDITEMSSIPRPDSNS